MQRGTHTLRIIAHPLLRLGLVLLAVVGTTSVASGAVWRLDNDEARSADFRTFQQAHDAAAPGDTIYVAGSGATYGQATITKRLRILGPGYLHGANNPLAPPQVHAGFHGILLKGPGASGSTLTGLHVSIASLILDDGVDNISITRNWLLTTVSINGGVANLLVAQNYVVSPGSTPCKRAQPTSSARPTSPSPSGCWWRIPNSSCRWAPKASRSSASLSRRRPTARSPRSSICHRDATSA